MILVSFVGAFVLTLIFGFKDEIEEESTTSEAPAAAETSEAKPLVEKIQILSPADGTVKDITEVPDPTFADKVLGDGAAVIPADGKIYAPADGTVVNIMDTKHGIMFQTAQGVELLIHIGLELLVEFDLDAIIKEGYDPITPIVVTNGDAYIRSVNMAKSGEQIAHGDCLLTIV